MSEMQPIYAPDLPKRLPGQPVRVVQVRNIPLLIAETLGEIADKCGERPDDVAARAIMHVDFLAKHEMAGGRFFVRTSGEDLLGGEDILRELDFGFIGPEHQGLKGKARRFLQRHRII